MIYSPASYTGIIFDLGDVLFKWSLNTTTTISPRTLRSILNSPTWFDYERGRLGEADCYAIVSSEFDVSVEEVRRAFQDARNSLQTNHNLIHLIRELKAQYNRGLRIYAMSNISLPDWEVLRTKSIDWSIFDAVFTSSAAGERKPHLGFYRYVISATGLCPQRTIFVDNKFDNILSARSLGFCGIMFEKEPAVRRALWPSSTTARPCRMRQCSRSILRLRPWFSASTNSQVGTRCSQEPCLPGGYSLLWDARMFPLFHQSASLQIKRSKSPCTIKTFAQRAYPGAYRSWG